MKQGERETKRGKGVSPITARIYGIPFMLSFRERSQVTIPGLRRSRNEISFASPRGTARAFQGESRSLPGLRAGVSSIPPPPPPPVGTSRLQSLPIFSSFREKQREVRHQGVHRKERDLVAGRYYSFPSRFSLLRSLVLAFSRRGSKRAGKGHFRNNNCFLGSAFFSRFLFLPVRLFSPFLND